MRGHVRDHVNLVNTYSECRQERRVRTLFVVEQELLSFPGLQTGSLHTVPVSDYYSISLPESQGTVAAHHDDLTPL